MQPYTFRNENPFLPANLRSSAEPDAYGDVFTEEAAFLKAGVDGFFADQADTALKRADIDLAVVEVGTGGRFDATNLLRLVSVITPISYDHTPTLGETLSQIAWHKAGILRAGRPGVLAPQVDEARLVVEREAQRVGRAARGGRPRVALVRASVGVGPDPHRVDARRLRAARHARRAAGRSPARQRHHRRRRAARARRRSSRASSVPRSALQAGLADVDWPGRLQVLSEQPLLVLDGAHNAASADVLRAAIDSAFRFERLVLVLGLSEGKDARGVLDALGADAPRRVYLTRSRHERSAAPAELAAAGARGDAPQAQVSRRTPICRPRSRRPWPRRAGRRPGAGDGIAVPGRGGSGVVAPLASVIVPTLNGAHLLPDCLDSLMRQSYANLEVIVADGASTDGTRRAAGQRVSERALAAAAAQRGLRGQRQRRACAPRAARCCAC